jgi:hypothetical protein
MIVTSFWKDIPPKYWNCKTTRRQNPKDHSPRYHSRENFRPKNYNGWIAKLTIHLHLVIQIASGMALVNKVFYYYRLFYPGVSSTPTYYYYYYYSF